MGKIKTQNQMKCLKKMLLIVFFTGASCMAHSQLPPELLWEKTYPGVYTDLVRQVMPASDGGFVIIGESDSFGPGIISTRLIKCDSTGNLQWDKSYGGASFDFPFSVEETADQGYIIATYSNSFYPEGNNLRLIKTDSEGDTLWTSIVPNSNGCILQLAGSIKQTPDQGYLLAGYCWQDSHCNQIALFKTDNAGTLEWFKFYGGASDDYGATIQATNDGNYILSGYTFSYGNGLCDGYLIKINPQGDTIWTSVVGGTNYDSYRFVRPTKDGGYIAVGSTQSYGFGEQGFVVKVDGDGVMEWAANVGGNQNEGFEGVVENDNQEYLITGTTNSYGNGQHDFMIVRMGNSGNEMGMKTYGGSGEDFGSTIEILPNKSYIATGTLTQNNSLEYWALCFSADSIHVAVSEFEPTTEAGLSFRGINPNPFVNQTNVSFNLDKPSIVRCKILDLNAKEIDIAFEAYLPSGDHNIIYENPDLKPGYYICRLQSEERVVFKKIIKIK
ncbi:T9SS type A sorting domain-containing protein [Candidatus Falkowbacteria bacterium]|jgi:hypothetical protein|nr:T9SS type A sorting domain-containing protein [Candidatus Falkowbacteria bacterium]